MAKFKINYQVTPNGSISWQHLGDDAQWAESGAAVKLLWQCNAGWGLQEAHYTTEGGVTVPIDITADVPQFVMPAENITIGGTFKRFVLGDWTDGHHETDDEVKVFKKGVNGQPVAVPAGEIVQGSTDSELSSTSENPVQNKVITEFLANLVEGLGDGSVNVLASNVKPDSDIAVNQNTIAEVVAMVLCSLNERVKSLENKDTVKCTNLVVERRADITGWREVDAAPAAANSAGTAGDYFVATDYIYICVAPDTWKRAALSTF